MYRVTQLKNLLTYANKHETTYKNESGWENANCFVLQKYIFDIFLIDQDDICHFHKIRYNDDKILRCRMESNKSRLQNFA